MRVGYSSVQDGKIVTDVLERAEKKHRAGRVSAAPEPARAPPDEPSPFAKVLSGLGREMDRGEALMKKAVEGGRSELGTGDLIALQAGVYRYSEAVDLSAKLVDRAANGVKTVLQGQ